MRNILVYFTVVGVLLIFTSLAASSDHMYSDNSIFTSIEKAYDRAEISLDDKVILQINAVKYPDKLPDKYQTLSASQSPSQLREATLVLIHIRTVWDDLSDDTRAYVSKALARTVTAFTYVSPSGYFKLHYDTIGTDAVPSLDADISLVPDFVEKCAAYCDSTLTKHLELGYLTPPNDGGSGGDTLFDVYFESMGFYGYAVPEGPGSYPWNDYYSYLVLNNDFIGFPSNDDPEGQIAGAAKATVAHEFHHCVQFAYDATEGSWYMELDATYMEDIVFDLVDDNYNYLPGFMNSPQTSLQDNSPDHKYASFIWNVYLAEKFDTSLNVAVWEGARYNTITSTTIDTLAARYNWTQDSAYTDFTYWNFCTGSRNDGLHFEEAASYPQVSISKTHIDYPVNTTNSLTNVAGYGSSYITFYPGTEIGKLRLNFNGSDTRDWKAYIIKSSLVNTHDIEFIELDSITHFGEIVVEDFQDYYSVTLVGVNVDEFSSGVLFTYSADIILPYEVSSIIITEDSAIYSGGERVFEYQVKNTSIINDIYHIIYWDDQGWLVQDTFSVAVASGDSILVQITVSPPQGTPLDQVSTLTFMAESWGDNTVTDVQTTNGKIFLQRGDVNFSGAVDIADIVYFVSYSFGGGPAPQPIVNAADFDCTDEVNISDLVSLINYSFNSGTPCPCNPY